MRISDAGVILFLHRIFSALLACTLYVLFTQNSCDHDVALLHLFR